MRILRENTATRISVGPFLNVGDGFTPELALTVTGIHLTLMVDDAGVPTLVLDADATASAGDNDMVHVTNDNAGMYDLELTAADVNFTGRAMLACIDDSAHLPVFHEFQIVSANVYDALFTDGDLLDISLVQINGAAQTATLDDIEGQTDDIGVAGAGLTAIPSVVTVTGNVDGSVGSVTAEVTADITKISGDAGAADNLEAQYDGAGLAGDTFPATQAQLAGIANVGSAVNITPDSYTLTTGTQSSGTVANVAALDGVNHEHTDAGPGSMDLYYEFLIGSGIPTSVTMTGYLNNNNDDLEVYGFDWSTSAWVRIGTLAGKNSATNEVNSYEMFVGMVGFAANEGIVRVRFTDGAFTLTTATLAIDQIFLSFSRGSEGYEDGAIWIDTTITNTNTVVGVDGTARNPVSTIAAANTLSVSTNLNRFHIAPGSSITFTASQQSQVFEGDSWTLALGGVDIANTSIIGAIISGIATGSGIQFFLSCDLSACKLPADTHIIDSGIEGTQTLPAGDITYVGCHSDIAGSGAPLFDFGAGVGVTNLNMRNYSGGLDIRNMGATGADVASIEGRGQIIINVNSSGGTMEIRGLFSLTDSGSVSITDDARYNSSKVNTEVDTALGDYDGPTSGEMDTAHALLTTPAQVATELGTYDGPTRSEATDDKDAILALLPASLVGGRIDADIGGISGDSDAAITLEALMDSVIGIGQINDASATTLAFATDGYTLTADDILKARLITFLTGAVAFEQADIAGFDAAGGTQGAQEITVTAALTSAPAQDVFFVVH